MNQADRYVKLVEWSDEDQCFIGSCPELFYGGCHGDDPQAVFGELCEILEEMVDLYQQEGKPLPPPMTGRDFVNTIQTLAAD
jgi:predicted RNase H-like HicB family nuclease